MYVNRWETLEFISAIMNNLNKISLKSRRYVPWFDEDGINILEGLDVLCKKYISKDMVVVEMGYHWGVSASLFSCGLYTLIT